MYGRMVSLALLAGALSFVGRVSVQSEEAIPLAAPDRSMLESLLGKGVVGKAVPAEPLGHVDEYFPLKEGKRSYRLTSGGDKGATEVHEISRLKRPKATTSWQYKVGTSDVHHLDQEKDGSVWIAATVENEHAVISRFSPREPGLLAGLKPGETKESKVDVKVYDLKDPKDVSHSGSTNVTYTYLGAYEVTVPAGTFNAALVKWHYKGKVGPASIEDVQYRFFAKGAGLIASVDKKNISAFLIYSDKSKTGKVLLEK